MPIKGRIPKAKLEVIKAYTVEIKTLSEKVNAFLKTLDYAIKMDPGGDWWVADLKDKDWCTSPKLKDLEALHKWIAENNRALQVKRLQGN